ncbi:MAG: ion channel [Gemmatimonadaceae bacterium]|jgi:inward rectifier potassium channel|nr:ion channel [Gemmatimonadaceae bacterium]
MPDDPTPPTPPPTTKPSALHTMEMSAMTTTSWRTVTERSDERGDSTDEHDPDLGFGHVVADESRERLLNRDGSFNVEREGFELRESLSLYHAAMNTGWRVFLSAVAAVYVAVNLLFAALYLLCGPGALKGTDPSIPDGGFVQAFLFSVQTIGTIGYGAIVPIGRGANAIVIVEAFLSILLTAVVTGLTIARFARPTARIRFSQQALIAPYGDGWALMFRMANARTSQLIELRAQVLFTSFVREGQKSVRRFDRLTLEREQVIFFPLAWTVVHPITAESPLWGLTPADLVERDAEVLVLLSGFDETHAQVVHARTSYKPTEILWNARFRSVFRSGAPGDRFAIDIRKIDSVERLDGSATAAR